MSYDVYEIGQKENERAWDTHSQSKTICPFCGEKVVPVKVISKGYEEGYCPRCRHSISFCAIDKAGLPIDWMSKQFLKDGMKISALNDW